MYRKKAFSTRAWRWYPASFFHPHRPILVILRIVRSRALERGRRWDSLAGVLRAVVAELPDRMEKSAEYHLEWARRAMNAFREHQAASGPVALGDLVVPLKMTASWPLVVVDAQYNKTGVVDLDTGEPKYFGAGYVTRLQGLRRSR